MAVLAAMPIALASDASLPEVGELIPAARRGKFNAPLEYAFSEQTGPFMADKVEIRHLNRNPTHWKHGGKADPITADLLSPHATAEQIKKCAFCLVVDLKSVYDSFDAVGSTDSWWKDLFRHEAACFHYNTWPFGQISNRDLFNDPHPGTGSEDGLNGSPGGPAGGHPYETDKCARKLYDAFDGFRTQYVEPEAALYGNTRAGCTQAPGYPDAWKNHKGDDQPPLLESDSSNLDDLKESLFGGPNGQPPGTVADAQAKMDAAGSGQAAAYAKLQAFVGRLSAAKQAMCDDIDALKAEPAKANAKSEQGGSR